MRKFKFEQVNSSPFKGLDGTVILWDGTDTTHHILVEKVTGLGIPSASVQTQRAPYQIGASPIRTTYGPRTIAFECAIIIDCKTTAGRAAMELVKRDLGKKFSTAGMGYVQETSLSTSNYTTITGKLSYSANGGAYDRFIDCIPTECFFPDREYSDGFQRFRLVLECEDPSWYGEEQESVMSQAGYLPSGLSLRRIAFGGRFFCGVHGGAARSTSVSQDAITWSTPTAPGGSGVFQAIVYSPEREEFCAVGTLGACGTSPDGQTWTYGTLPNTAVAYFGVAWSDVYEKYCAVSSAGDVATSSDGLNWTAKTPSAANAWGDVTWSKEIGKFCAVANSGTDRVMLSTNGDSWTGYSVPDVRSWVRVQWSRVAQVFCAIAADVSSTNIMTSPDGQTWTTRTGTAANALNDLFWSDVHEVFISINDAGGSTPIATSPTGQTWTARSASITQGSGVSGDPYGTICVLPLAGATSMPVVSYDAVNFISPNVLDYFKEITNDGDVPAEFEIDIPVAGGETSKVIAIGDNFLWSGTGTPPSDHNLVFGTDGLKKGIVTVSTTFNDKDIRQFGVSKFANYQQGEFFSLYVSGATTNNIYVRNTGTSAGAPIIRWKNRYFGV